MGNLAFYMSIDIKICNCFTDNSKRQTENGAFSKVYLSLNVFCV
jgi:hypothetical protein